MMNKSIKSDVLRLELKDGGREEWALGNDFMIAKREDANAKHGSMDFSFLATSAGR